MKLSKIIYIAACGIALASCQGMDLTPPDKYSEKDFWKTAQDYCLAANESIGIWTLSTEATISLTMISRQTLPPHISASTM